ncbi:hypothetical protein [Halococcus thailandensis]|jgi:hypothetical protein|uniref:Uncharacterized protein n=1 Tax=Halococcus thailandensis JCM 13552 TaxID=1227457 RepID=M0MWA9_9EURY|nr:hypothetical protein [Halococcus thailandensis]EMA49114.1 hypothetical protein C451_19543 [Halococcus thailandensis JCM 13552]
MSHDTQSRSPTEQPEQLEQQQYPAAETVAHLSKATYHQRIETLAERILPRLADETGTIQTVNYNTVLGHLQVIERMSFDNPFSILEHSEYELDGFDWKRINNKDPVHGLAEQARRLVAGDVQQRLLELVATDDTRVGTGSPHNGGQR